ncbi:hypothetical protein LEMLEM_LOCUS20557, partial [Lemmus lemmus]
MRDCREQARCSCFGPDRHDQKPRHFREKLMTASVPWTSSLSSSSTASTPLD